MLNKERIEREIEEIEFPKEDVFNAIDRGISRGKKRTYQSRMKKAGVFSSAAAAAFLASGLLFAPVSNVLAAVPVIGGIYEKYSMQIGQELFSSGLITGLDETAEEKGVAVKITSAYYDGNVIGISFLAEGGNPETDEEGPEAGYNIHLFDGKDQSQWSASMGELKETDEGYAGAVEFYSPNAELPENFTLPLTFNYVNGVHGSWKFDVPVEKIPAETFALTGESTFDDYKLKMNSMTKGAATTLLYYTVELPLKGKGDTVELTVFDNDGERLSKRNADILSTEIQDGKVIKEVRELLSSKIDENIAHLTVKPEIRMRDDHALHSLNTNSPFTVESERFDYQIQVNEVQQDGNEISVDFDISGIEDGAFRDDILQNFADFVTLMPSDQVKRDDNNELMMNEMIEHWVLSDQAVRIGDDLRFKSTFQVEGNANNYDVMVPFDSFSGNSLVEMEAFEASISSVNQ
ncbi:DUF4179 domain-containing protein [Jeotgalibacillus haloalkalitolerans]|uniref:DUF4179 domain-containing protein n=1 Tax=Jeotgalibacillus haloalkalitolerans TaxID=3104292 RepID=A0ABU5KHJ4_9BACL|nr:DUF4179 domain-containing protein [Jeotgalibacillus sp. HH7-29]MDZ5710692.1 DUF4179 domain-containing protein [Jeotgalibacillus sp. HH7-29]